MPVGLGRMSLRTLVVVWMLLSLMPHQASASIGGRLSPGCGLDPTQHGMTRSKFKTSSVSSYYAKTTPSLFKFEEKKPISTAALDSVSRLRAGGQAAAIPVANGWDQTVRVLVQATWTCCRIVLPPVAYATKLIVGFYRSLPKDAITAQAGLVYCFAGGYYPALFAAVQAAQNCGWQTMCQALDDLGEQAGAAIDAVSNEYENKASPTARAMFQQTTMTILKTVDPVKINQATGALYTTWLGVSTVLEREFAKTIALSVSIAGYVQPIASFMFKPPLRLCVPQDYQQWIPVLIGWGCKAAAMSIAWRVQRVFSIYTSAITGGLMFSRACMRMLAKRGVRMFGMISDDERESALDEVLGFAIAGFGVYSQIETGIDTGFSMRVPFPMSLVTWPFDIAEKWIEWKIQPDPV